MVDLWSPWTSDDAMSRAMSDIGAWFERTGTYALAASPIGQAWNSMQAVGNFMGATAVPAMARATNTPINVVPLPKVNAKPTQIFSSRSGNTPTEMRGGRPTPTGTFLPSTFPGMSMDKMLQDLQTQRNIMISRRNAAISAAGRGAGAPYAAQIARIDSEIAKQQNMLGGVGSLFDEKIKVTEDWVDSRMPHIQSSVDPHVDQARRLGESALAAVNQVYSREQQGILSSLNNVPGMDEATKAGAIQAVGVMQDEILNMVEIDSSSTAKYLQAAENLAVALAKKTKAEGTLAFVRQKTQIESEIKVQIQNMLEDKKQAQRAQSAAVSAARAMEAARWPDNVPMDQTNFARLGVAQFIGDRAKGLNDLQQSQLSQIAIGLYENGIDSATAKKLLSGPPRYNMETGRPVNQSAQAMATLGWNEGDWYNNFGSLRGSMLTQARLWLPHAMQAGNYAVNYWDTNYAQGDPNRYAQGSMDWYFATSATLGQYGMTGDDLRFTVEDESTPTFISQYARPEAPAPTPRSSTRSSTTPTTKKPTSGSTRY